MLKESPWLLSAPAISLNLPGRVIKSVSPVVAAQLAIKYFSHSYKDKVYVYTDSYCSDTSQTSECVATSPRIEQSFRIFQRRNDCWTYRHFLPLLHVSATQFCQFRNRPFFFNLRQHWRLWTDTLNSTHTVAKRGALNLHWLDDKSRKYLYSTKLELLIFRWNFNSKSPHLQIARAVHRFIDIGSKGFTRRASFFFSY